MDVCHAAVANLEAALSELSRTVETFTRTTPTTAKAASIEVLRSAHRVLPSLMPTERGYLRELEILLGAPFRKFFESCERHDDTNVMRRAPELRENLQRYTLTQDDPRAYSDIWIRVVAPIVQHVSTIVDDATKEGEASLSPVLSLSNPSTKADLSIKGQEVTLVYRLANSGQGQAIDITLDAHGSPFKLVLAEPHAPFAVGPEGHQIVSLRLKVVEVAPSLNIPIKWHCKTATGSTRSFDDLVTVEQQASEPDWDRLLSDPRYSLNPIKRRERLYGRTMTLNQLTLAAFAGASTFLWGQKRIGKTSLLQVLASTLSERPESTCIVLRMGEITSLHEGQIAHRIAERLVEASGISITIPKEEDLGAGLSRLVPFVEKLVGKKPNHKFIVIIDEFDDLDPSFYMGERGRQFVKALRSLSEIGLTLFFVGSERMDTIYSRHQTDLNKWRNFTLDKIDNRQDCRVLPARPREFRCGF